MFKLFFKLGGVKHEFEGLKMKMEIYFDKVGMTFETFMMNFLNFRPSY